MPMTLEQIVEETSQWPDDVVAELVDRIMLARHGGLATAVEEARRPEIHRRVAEIRSGRVKGVPGEKVSTRVRKIVGR